MRGLGESFMDPDKATREVSGQSTLTLLRRVTLAKVEIAVTRQVQLGIILLLHADTGPPAIFLLVVHIAYAGHVHAGTGPLLDRATPDPEAFPPRACLL